jgi:hypothetical protein
MLDVFRECNYQLWGCVNPKALREFVSDIELAAAQQSE